MKKIQKVKVEIDVRPGWAEWYSKIGNVALYSDPYSSGKAAVRGARAFFARHLPDKTPVIEEMK